MRGQAVRRGLGEPIRLAPTTSCRCSPTSDFAGRILDFNELALDMLGDYQRERQFRSAARAVLGADAGAGWP